MVYQYEFTVSIQRFKPNLLSIKLLRVPLYLRIVCVCSAVSIYPSLYGVLPDLFLSLYSILFLFVFFSTRPSLYSFVTDLFVSLYRSFRSCSCFSQLDRIYQSASLCCLPDLFLSFFTCHSNLVRVRVLLLPPLSTVLSIRLVNVLYRIFYSLFTCCSDLVRLLVFFFVVVVLLPVRLLPLRIAESILN